ncbi:MAG: FKBP-type peptidyl-prolyl cis-trans isomerase [Halomonadaceae bacterium]|nr:MAG: FKBP-type peptidyl-prolyl cis-trans isomerase [Halomonadaceae bacterium]
MSKIIATNSRVTLHFALRLEDGTEVDSTFEREPAVLVIGDGNLPEGFERYLFGLYQGDQETFKVPPEDAFGQANPNNIQEFKRDEFAPDMELEEGLVLSFADARQSELPGVVQSFDDDKVVVNFNHPLAGKTLTFEVKIVDVQ